MEEINNSKIIKELGDKLLFIDDKIDLENNVDRVSEEMVEKLYKIVKIIVARDRRRGEKESPPGSENRDPERNDKIKKIIECITHIRGSREKRSPIYVKTLLQKICSHNAKHFTGTITVDFEENEIMDVHTEEMSPGDTELPEEIKIEKQDIDYLFEYFDTPDNLAPELQDLLVGIPKEKLEYARSHNVEYIMKKPFLKLDGTIGWDIEIP